MGLFSHKNNKNKEQEAENEFKKAQELRNKSIIEGCYEHTYPIPYYYDENGDVQVGEKPKANSGSGSQRVNEAPATEDVIIEDNEKKEEIEEQPLSYEEMKKAQEIRNRDIIEGCNEHTFPIPYYYDENGDVQVGEGPEIDDGRDM